MAEAEDVLIDLARHATDYARSRLHARRVARDGDPRPLDDGLTLADAAPRLDLLLSALMGGHWAIRVAQPPSRARWWPRWLGPPRPPAAAWSLPCAHAGHRAQAVWLPRDLRLSPGTADARQAALLYRAMALLQAERARIMATTCEALDADARDGPMGWRDVWLVLQVQTAEAALLKRWPGLAPALQALRAQALAMRPPLGAFASSLQPAERWLRGLLQQAPLAAQETVACLVLAERARRTAAQWQAEGRPLLLLKDWWTGDWPEPGAVASAEEAAASPGSPQQANTGELAPPAPSARLPRRPRIRTPRPDEDQGEPGAWMIQTAQPHEHAEDPMGLQRPSDRDTDSAPESHAESLSELNEARLVRSGQPAREVLLSDDLPERPADRPRAPSHEGASADQQEAVSYPEWDRRIQGYRDRAVTVWAGLAREGPQAWVDDTMARQQGLHQAVRRRFELLRSVRVVRHGQEDGDELDLDAWVHARADWRAGAALSPRLYRAARLSRRDCAVLVLVDISGSTDAWVQGERRVIDVEREALLLLSQALDASGDRHAVQAFSGEGPHGVQVQAVKRFGERHDGAVARRIAGLAPQRQTRAGAALRHASRCLAAQPARHQLLLLLSDGKPHDVDDYDGLYGVEDMRQAVREARAQGQALFSLTVDRQAARYLPAVFGAQHYALLQSPAALPAVLLQWMKRLLLS